QRVRKLLTSSVCSGLLAASVCGCGLNVASPDLFLLQRTGPAGPLSLVVNDGGTIRCNGAKPKALSDPLLIRARALASDLDQDAKNKLRISPPSNSVAVYTITLQD